MNYFNESPHIVVSMHPSRVVGSLENSWVEGGGSRNLPSMLWIGLTDVPKY